MLILKLWEILYDVNSLQDSEFQWPLIITENHSYEETNSCTCSFKCPTIWSMKLFSSPHKTSMFCRICLSLSQLWGQILQSWLQHLELGMLTCVLWLARQVNCPAAWVALLWLQIGPNEMSENCFWIKVNENKYESTDLLCKLENTFCCQQKGKFDNSLVINLFWNS